VSEIREGRNATSSDGPPPLRRSYSFVDGVDPTTGQINAGLVFIAFQRDPARQFIPIQRRMAGTQPGGFVGETLFAKL